MSALPAGRGLAAAALLLLCAAPAPAQEIPPSTSPALLLDALESAWQARDRAAYLRLWRFDSERERQEETAFVESAFGGDLARMQLRRPRLDPRSREFEASAEAFSAREPRARVEQLLFTARQGEGGWAFVGRERRGQVDGLVHLSLDPAGYDARGLTLKLDDLTLELHRGTLFGAPEALGPTVFTFVGEGTVRFRPPDPAEQRQLRAYGGQGELVDTVRAAFLRLHPADLARVLVPLRLEKDPQARRRLAEAEKYYREQVDGAFVLDANLPRSPWWMLPGVGDSYLAFQTRRHGTLTYAVSRSEPEDVSLFDRGHRRLISLYPSAGRSRSYDEDEGRAADVLEHDLHVRFDPGRFLVEGEDTLRLDLLLPTSALRLRLDDALTVRSVRSAEGGEHLFFRVRHQDTIMVSLGPLAARTGEVRLTVTYGGTLRPQPVDRELLRQEPAGSLLADEAILIDDVTVYSNRNAWYPQAATDDHALMRLTVEVPEALNAVTGGRPEPPRVEGGRRVQTFVQEQPGKYVSVALGRLLEMGSLAAGPLTLQAWSVGRLKGQATEMLATAAEIVAFFTKEFGPAPYPRLNLVSTEARTPGGHSPPGAVIVARRPPLMRTQLADDPASFAHIPSFFLAHEIAHQWWGHGVAGENYRERWLSEGMAQYAAALWVRHHLGEDTFLSVLRKMGRWALLHNAEGPIRLGHRLGLVEGDPQVYRAVVYDKGAYVLHMLRALVGEDAFRRALLDLQQSHRFGKAGSDDLRAALERASGQALAPYFEQWVYGTALPELSWRWRTAPGPEGTRTTVEVVAAGLPGPLPLRVTLDGAAQTVMVPPGGGHFDFTTARAPRRVEVNGDLGLLARFRNP